LPTGNDFWKHDTGYGIWTDHAGRTAIATQLGSMSYAKCPSRRGGGTDYYLTADGQPEGNPSVQGARGDYAIVMVHGTLVKASWWDGYEHWRWHDVPWEPMCAGNIMGPFRAAVGTDSGIIRQQAWTPRDTFAWLADGTSNQLLAGDKHIPKGRLGQCAQDNWPAAADCSYLSTGDFGGPASARAVIVNLTQGDLGSQTWYNAGLYYPIARTNDDYVVYAGGGPYDGYGFGSNHPGVCNFVIGDGSVTSVQVNISRMIFACLARVNDGMAVSLP